RVERVDPDRSVVVPVEGQQVGQVIAVVVDRDDLRSGQVVRTFRRLPYTGPTVHRLQAARGRREHVDADPEIGVLVDRCHLIGTIRTREVPDGEARASRVVLSDARVVNALVPAVDELLAIRLEVVDAHVEVVVLVDGE